ncbi:hypothetical protein ABIE78_004033 [Sinorhizobium fredii]
MVVAATVYPVARAASHEGGALTKLLGTALLDPSDKAIAANPVLRDAILALQKQAGAGNAKAVANAYSQF